MNYSVHNNIQMMNVNRQYRISNGMKSKSMEKLSSGYRINRAADDAANLTISEKMRLQIRGLNQGTDNAQDGASWVQIGDGSLEEVHDMLHRMEELAIKSMNGTNTAADRAAMQEEFERLQCEIDRLTEDTRFNTKHIFYEHDMPYYQFNGNIQWIQSQPHLISADNNDLTVQYRIAEGETPKTATIQIPDGIYTTQELIDEIDSAFEQAGLRKEGISLEYTQDGYCNLNLDGGEVIDEVTGGLSYLLYDSYGGGSLGALIGTTVFPDDITPLPISKENNTLIFTIAKTDGSTEERKIELTPDVKKYTRPELINVLNGELADTTVKAVPYGSGIRLESDDSIITGLKGNMFKIDTGKDVYTSVFYDNIKYGIVTDHEAVFTGGAVLYTSSGVSAEFRDYWINDQNDTLVFRPNGSDQEYTFTIPHPAGQAQEYTPQAMAAELNAFFNSQHLDLRAEEYTKSVGSTYYAGLRIISGVKGLTSDVGIDRAASTAFDTLFVDRKKRVDGVPVYAAYDREAETKAYVIGEKFFSGSRLPLTITSGKNDKFKLNLGDGAGAYTITLSEGVYDTAEKLKDEIDAQLNGAGASAGYKGKLEVGLTGAGAIFLTEAGDLLQMNADTMIKNITLSEVTGNTGYRELFIGGKEIERLASEKKDVNGCNEATCNTPVVDENGNITIPAGKTTFRVKVDGKDRYVTLDAKTYTKEALKQKLDDALKSFREQDNVRFSKASMTGGKSVLLNDSYNSAQGHINTKPSSGYVYHNEGKSKPNEGLVGKFEWNIAATVTLNRGNALPTEIDGSNDTLKLTINGREETLQLAHGTGLKAEEIRKDIQAKIDDRYGTDGDGAIVTLNGGYLVITARLTRNNGTEINGAATNISVGNDTSSFMKAVHTSESTGKFTVRGATSGGSSTSNAIVSDRFKVESGRESFTIDYTPKGSATAEKLQVKLTPGTTYTRESLEGAINTQCAGKVKASISSAGIMTLETVDSGGAAVALKRGSNQHNALWEIFGQISKSATLDKEMQNTIKVDGSNNRFQLYINGEYSSNKRTVTVPSKAGGYTRTEFVKALDDQLKNLGVRAALDGNKIKLTTDPDKGVYSCYVSYDESAGSVMPAMFGTQEVTRKAVTADFTQDGKLVLKEETGGTGLRVSSTYGSVFQLPDYEDALPREELGYRSKVHAKIDGVDLKEPVTIDQWNKELNFLLYEKGTTGSYSGNTVSVTLAEGTYSFAGLKKELQEQLDQHHISAGKLEVNVDKNGVVIQTKQTGNSIHMGERYYAPRSTFSGGFYTKILCGGTEEREPQKFSDIPGSQGEDGAYAVGRKDVRNEPVKISKGVNDRLQFDLSRDGTPLIHFDLTLNEGIYKGASLANMIQGKLNEALADKGYPAGMVLAGVGGKINTGIIGSNDANALNFRLNMEVPLPGEGEYVIDGVSGTAAFSVFYQTEGDIGVAYIKGTKNIGDGVTVHEGATGFSFEVDGKKYQIDLPAGTYSGTELVEQINTLLKDPGTDAPVVAKMEDGSLKLVSTKYGKHRISNVGGDAKRALFLEGNGEKGERGGIPIQFSSKTDDYIVIDRPVMSTVSLGINSIVISKAKYAGKALERLGQAVSRVSDVRSYFGATQNRLEHSIANNENKAENTQASESRLRDTDMAREMLENSKRNILAQAMESVMAQANSQQEGVLRLIEG